MTENLTPGTDAEARILLSMPDAARDRVLRLRQLVREVVPTAEERAHAGWGIFNFYLNGELLYIGAQGEVAILGFSRGSQLTDPDGLLVATKTARYMRQMRFATDELPEAAIRQMVAAAAQLNIERGPPEREWRRNSKGLSGS